MSTSVLCTNNTAWIGDPGYLYLPTGWYEKPWYQGSGRTILDIPNEPYNARLYVLSQGPIWIVPKKKQYWRLDVRPDRIRYYRIGLNVSTKLWTVDGKNLVRAEQTDYETLRLEAVFGVTQ
jgi:hypothetical protein